ncbi:MAG: ubiquitin-like small modifier protein 1 [bacterium]
MSEGMGAVVRIPAPLRAYAGGREEVEVSGVTVADALRDLASRYPQLRRHLYDDHGRLRAFVNVFLNERDVRDLEGEATRLGPGDTLTIVPSVAGGRAMGHPSAAVCRMHQRRDSPRRTRRGGAARPGKGAPNSRDGVT